MDHGAQFSVPVVPLSFQGPQLAATEVPSEPRATISLDFTSVPRGTAGQNAGQNALVLLRPNTPSTPSTAVVDNPGQQAGREPDPIFIVIAVDQRLAAAIRQRALNALHVNQFWSSGANVNTSPQAHHRRPSTTSSCNRSVPGKGKCKRGHKPKHRAVFINSPNHIFNVKYPIRRRVAGVKMSDTCSPSKRRKTKGPYMKSKRPLRESICTSLRYSLLPALTMLTSTQQ